MRKQACLQFCVGQSEQRHRQARVDDLGGDAVDVLVLETFDRVPAAAAHLAVSFAHMLSQFLSAFADGPQSRDREGHNSWRDQ